MITEHTYDHRGRLLDTKKKVNAGTQVLVSRNAYNEVGQLRTKRLHSTDGSAWGQTVTYGYNTRGWLTATDAPLFKQVLGYDGGSAPQYNGNISSQAFTRHNLADPIALVTDTYGYTYDGVNRLLQGAMAGSKGRETLTYTKNGNIKTLVRTGTSSTAVDNLAYTYSGNRLASVSDAAASTDANFQLPGTTAYTYDANGNVKTRVNSGSTGNNITAVTYNYLNLPQSVTAVAGNVTYTYDGTGRKLRSVNGIVGQTRDYVDGIEYSGGVMELVQTEEGRILRSGSTYTYHYFLRDHLGNNRVGFAQGTNVTVPNFTADYYPFGLQYRQYIRAGSPKNNYLYNGKELQDGIKQYDYSARFYDPVIGRWGSMDPLAESYHSHSPYNYGLNNPVIMIDPSGMAPWSTHTDEEGNVIAVYDDDDLGVYLHQKNADGSSVTKAQLDKRHAKSTSAGGEKMGETEFWDEFIIPGTDKASGNIIFSDDPQQSWDILVEWVNSKANNQDLSLTMEDSKNGHRFDIKVNTAWTVGTEESRPMTGRLLNGKYATARSAGNYVAGMNGMTGTFQGQYISGETYMKLAGAYQQRQLSTINAAKIVSFGTSYGPAPYYGEEPYSGRRILQGIQAGLKRR